MTWMLANSVVMLEVPSVWQVIATDVVNGGYAMDEFKHKTSRKFKLTRSEQGDTETELHNEFCFTCSRSARSRNSPHNGHCLNSALLFTAHLQKRLNVAGGKKLGSAETSCHPVTVSLPFNKVSVTDVHLEGTKLIGQSLSAPEGGSEFRSSAGLSNVVTKNDLTTLTNGKSSLPIVNGTAKHVKVEPDMNLSWRNSSITTEFNTAGIKEESSVEMYLCQEPLHSLCLKSDVVGQSPVGFRFKTNTQHFSGQMDQDYYVDEKCKIVKMVTKGRPRFRTERQRPLLKKRPTYFCIADLLFQSNDCFERAVGARVELQSKVDRSFVIAVHTDGKSFEQKVQGGGMLAKNPPELSWKSGNGWALEFSDGGQWDLFRSMYNELCSQAMRSTCVKEIPIPVVKETETFNGEAQARSSLRPFFAIKSPGQEIDTAYRSGRVLYDLDSEDELWLTAINRSSRDSAHEIISDDTLEQVIDRLEKEAYRRGEETVTVHDAIEVCQGLAGADSMRAAHAYWSKKRLAKGMSLLRYFQPPLWKQYQEELRAWENRMQQYSPDAQNTLIDRDPRPIMSAFCLQSRSFDTLDTGKRMLRQRSQRKIRPTSRSSSEESQRLPVYHNSDSIWHLTRDSECPLPTTPLYQHLDHGQEEGLPDGSNGARGKATEARRIAERKAMKLQRRFLEFDLLLQKAWAFFIEYSVSDGDASAQTEALEGRMARLFTGCSSLFSRGDDSSEDEPPSGQVCGDVGEEFLEAFSNKCSLNGRGGLCKRELKAGDDFQDASPLLPFFVKGTSFAWNGLSLL
ncbi:hypothetical protein L7F22_004078 [Adiantum nelumboides]|nr:hypothetical protein [Adiantum nelumboides]